MCLPHANPCAEVAQNAAGSQTKSTILRLFALFAEKICTARAAQSQVTNIVPATAGQRPAETSTGSDAE